MEMIFSLCAFDFHFPGFGNRVVGQGRNLAVDILVELFMLFGGSEITGAWFIYIVPGISVCGSLVCFLCAAGCALIPLVPDFILLP